MFNMGAGELALILLLALIVLGPDKLPEAARKAGKYLAEFRRISGGFQQEFRDAMDAAMATPPDKPAGDDGGTGAFSLPAVDGREAEVAPADESPAVLPGSETGDTADGNGTGANGSDIGPAPSAGAPAAPRPPAPPARVMVDGPSGSFR